MPIPTPCPRVVDRIAQVITRHVTDPLARAAIARELEEVIR
jgi:hypothetical protein